MVAVFGTQAVATLIAVYGLLMHPIGWGLALFVWGYALVWFLVNDRVKLLGYRILGSFDEPVLLGAGRSSKQSAARRLKPSEGHA